jgi:GTPase
MPKEDAAKRCRDIVKRLKWKAPVYEISAISGDGTRELTFDIMNYLEENDEAAQVR